MRFLPLLSSRFFWLCGVLAVALVSWFWVWPHFAGGAPGGGMGGMGGMSLPVEAAPVVEKPISLTQMVVGQLQAEHGAVLKSEITARVMRIGFTEGQPVQAGTLLIQLDDATARAALAQAEANLAVSEANLGRYSRLMGIGAASPLQVDTAAAAAKLARANVQSARAALAKTRITAPFRGTAGIAQVAVGQTVQPGQDLIAITDNTTLKTLVTLPEQQAAALRPGMMIPLQRDADDSASPTRVQGRLVALDGRVDPTTRTVTAKIMLADAPSDFISGQFIRALVPYRSVSSALVVPDSALVPQGTETFVYTLNPGPKGMVMASKTTVTVGLRAQNEAQITSGVTAGQRVVVAGQQKMMAPVMPVMPLSPTVVTRSAAAVETLNTATE